MTQDCAASESTVATPRSGGGNLGTQGHDASYLSFVRGLIFDTKIITAYACVCVC